MKLAREEHVKGATELLFRMEKEYLLAVKNFRNRSQKFFESKDNNEKTKNKKKKKKSGKKKESNSDSQNSNGENLSIGTEENVKIDTDRFGSKLGGEIVFGETKASNRERLIETFSHQIELGCQNRHKFKAFEKTLWIHPSCAKMNSAVESRGMTYLAQNTDFTVRDTDNLRIGFSDLVHVFFKISDLISPEVSCSEQSEKKKFAIERLMGYWYILDEKEIWKWETNLSENLADEKKRKQMSEIINFESGYLEDSMSMDRHMAGFKFTGKNSRSFTPYFNPRDTTKLTQLICQCNDLVKTDNCSLCRQFLFMCDKLLDLKMNRFAEYFSNFLEVFVFYSYCYLSGKKALKEKKRIMTGIECYLECEKLEKENEFFKFVVGFCLRNWRHFTHYEQSFGILENYFYLFDSSVKKYRSHKELSEIKNETFNWLQGTNQMKPNFFEYNKKDIFFLKNERVKKLGLQHKSIKLLRLSSTICHDKFFDILYYIEQLKMEIPKELVFISIIDNYFNTSSNHDEMETLIQIMAEDYGLQKYLVYYIFANFAKKYNHEKIIQCIKIIQNSSEKIKFRGFFNFTFTDKYTNLILKKKTEKEAFKDLIYFNDKFLDNKIQNYAIGIFNKFKEGFLIIIFKIYLQIWIYEDDNDKIKLIFDMMNVQNEAIIRVFKDFVDVLKEYGKTQLAIELTKKAIWEKQYDINISEFELTEKLIELYQSEDENENAIEAANKLILTENLECNQFREIMESLYYSAKYKKTLMMKLETLLENYIKIVKYKPDLDLNDGQNILKIKYKVYKNLYGRGHPAIKEWIMEAVDNVVERNGYLDYQMRRKIFKYFVGTSQLELGFEIFMKLWLNDFNYAVLEKLCSLGSMTGNYQKIYDKMMEHFDRVEDDPDNLDYVTDLLIDANQKELAINLWDKLKQYREHDDNKDETFYEYTMKFYRDQIGDIDTALKLFREAMDNGFFFYKYEIDELAAICFSKEKGKEFMNEFKYYVTTITNGNQSVIRLYVEMMRTVHSPKEMITQLDNLLEEMNVCVFKDACDKGEQIIFKKKNILTCLEFDSDNNQKTDFKEVHGGSYAVNDILALKGKESYRDLFLTNRYKGKTDLGLDYSITKKPVTSIAEMNEALPLFNNHDSESFNLIKVIKERGVKIESVKSQISDFLHSLQMDRLKQLENENCESKKEEPQTDDLLEEGDSLCLDDLFDFGDETSDLESEKIDESIPPLLFCDMSSGMSLEENSQVDKSDDQDSEAREDEIKEDLSQLEGSTCAGVDLFCAMGDSIIEETKSQERESVLSTSKKETIKNDDLENDLIVKGTSAKSIQTSTTSKNLELKYFCNKNDILGPNFKDSVIYDFGLKDVIKEEIMKNSTSSYCTVAILIYARAKSQAMTGDFKGGIAYLSANYGVFDNFQNQLYEFCKDHMELEDMKNLNNIFYGTLKNCFLDLMKIKNFVKAEHAKEGEDETLCVICYDNIEEGELFSRGGCDHVFHAACSFSWIRENSNCPLCRYDYSHD